MILNIILGFVIPWMFCIMHLYKREKLLLLLIAPPTSVLAYVINTFTFYFSFAEVFPFPNPKNLASLPFSLGLYPISAGYLIFFIRKFKKPYFIIIFNDTIYHFFRVDIRLFRKGRLRQWLEYLFYISLLFNPLFFSVWVLQILEKTKCHKINSTRRFWSMQKRFFTNGYFS